MTRRPDISHADATARMTVFLTNRDVKDSKIILTCIRIICSLYRIALPVLLRYVPK